MDMEKVPVRMFLPNEKPGAGPCRGPTCRRCKADLAPLAELEARRALALNRATRAAALGDGDAVLRHAHAAQQLRAGPDALRWLAAGHLLRRDFSQALAYYRLLMNSSP
jgi:hypothetical protein